MPETAKQIDPPIERDLGDNPGLVRFATYAEVLEWAEREAAVWHVLDQHRDVLPPLSTDVSLQRQEAIPRQLANAARHALQAEPGADLSDIDRRISNALARYANHECLHAASSDGRLVLNLIDHDPPAALALLALQTGAGVTVADRGRRTEHDLLPLVYAVSRAAIASLGGPAALEIEEAALKDLRDDWNTRFAEKQTTLETVATDVATWLGEQKSDSEALARIKDEHQRLLTEHKQRISRLESDYAQRVGLRGAGTFWAAKRRRHLVSAVVAGLAFPAVAVAIIYAALWFALNGQALTENLPGLTTTLNDTANAVLAPVATTIALGLFILFGIWILQIISRVFLTSFAAMNDAGARIAMVQTYLALAKDSSVSATTDRQVILRALFAHDPVVEDLPKAHQ